MGCEECVSEIECLKCSDETKILDTTTLECWDECELYTINIEGSKYCRSLIYVNPDSSSDVEIGTIEHPYKTIDSAFNEVWNYWTDLTW